MSEHGTVPAAELRPCCRAYLTQGEDLIAEWHSVIREHPEEKADLEWAINQVEEIQAEIRAGAYRYGGCCPWDGKPEWGIDGYKNYLAVVEIVGSDPDWEKRLGPIEVTQRG